ncbi:hypothetical protein PDE_01649 [Penicillium oxalicum 114-2]|uniref:Uncharacterized protein n=1 Tax=Penicillium oxalicum (strain 114-2 / CGMCC 5302) TaxID=933388 RepID=S7ZDF0_PENO1|nr:hypothetical protein PDE_01649 [Penicillium oxalicum 114-2]
MMEVLSRRVSTSCTGSKLWYVCSAGGGFMGCCSSDPCTTGICPDEDSNSASYASAASSSSSSPSSSLSSSILNASASSVLSTAIKVSPSTVLQNFPSSSLSTLSTSTASSSAPTASAESSQSPALPSPSDVAANVASPSKAPMIGGIVGALAALILLILLCWSCCCSRKKNRLGKSFGPAFQRLSKRCSNGRENSSPTKTELFFLEKRPTRPMNDSLHSHQRPLPPNNPSEQDNTSMTNPTANSATTAPTISFNSSGFSTLGSGILSISSDGFVRLPSLRRASPPGEMLGTIPQSNQSAVELSDTGFYRQRAELSAHSQRELINVPLENRRGASPLAQDFLTESNHATATATTGRSSPEGLVLNSASATDHSEVEAASLTNRETVRKIVTREGIVLGSNLEQYSPVVGSGSARTPSADGSGNRHVLSFMTFGAENSGIPGARETPRRANARSLVTGTCTGDEVASHTIAEINGEGDNAMGDEAPPAYESGGVPPRQKEKSPSGTGMRWSLEQ